jgi:hypothetical protein
VVRAYLEAVDEDLVATSSEGTEDPDALLGVREVTLHAADGRLTTDFEHGEPLVVRLHCQARADVRDVAAQVTIRGDYGPLFTADSAEGGERYDWARGGHGLECAFESLPVLPGLYRVEVLLRHRDSPPYAVPRSLAAFRVNTDLAEFGSRSIVGVTKSRGGFLAVPYAWRLATPAGTQPLAGIALPAR